MITPESIDRVREAADIVDIVGEHVKLRRTGADYRGACPFHGGKNPNFSVSPRRGAYHCFKCGVSGDVFEFVREKLGLDFVEAVRHVAARAGVEVQETVGRRDEQTADPREPLWEALAAAADFFHDTLWADDEARATRDYLASRGLGREEADRFGLGYSPRDGGRLRQHLGALGHDDDRLIAAGLLVRREGEEVPRSRFWGRLMFPILDASGRTVGFGGRVIGQGEPKYLNSPESEVYTKGRLLYGLSWARHPIRKADRVLLVEGYFDAIRLALAGVEEVVAPLGTALTEQQASLLARLTRNVFLLYDNDPAGQRATFRSGRELLRLGVSPRVVSLPEGEDPDTFVRQHGVERLEGQLAHSIDLFERQVLELQRRGWFAELHRKRKAIDRLLPTLRDTADELTRGLYAARLAEVSGVDRDALLREAAERPPRGDDAGGGSRDTASRAPQPPAHGSGARRGGAGGASANGILFVDQPRSADRGSSDRGGRQRGGGDRRFGRGRRGDDWFASNAVARVVDAVPEVGAEQALVQAMLVDRHYVDTVAERFGPGTFEHPVYRAVFERLLAAPDADAGTLADGLAETAVVAMQRLLDQAPPNLAAQVAAGLGRLRSRELDRQLAALDDELKLSPSEDRKDAINAEKVRIVAERQAVRGDVDRVGKAGF